jgi:hypothetical protein
MMFCLILLEQSVQCVSHDVLLGGLVHPGCYGPSAQAAIWLPGAFAPGFFKKLEQIENLSKNSKKTCMYLTMARTNV